MTLTDRVKARAKHPTGGAVTGRLANHDPRNNARINSAADRLGHGKGVKGTSIDDARNHHSAPLSTLKDPAAFGPPPKHVNYHGAAATSPTSSPVGTNPPALPTSSKPVASKPAAAASKPAPRPAAGGLGAPIPTAELQARREEEKRAAEEAANAPSVPYRVNTTGLSTEGLPKPPVRRLEEPEEYVPQPRARPAPAVAKPKPQPPPRLPARQNSNPTEFTPSPPPAYAAATEHEPQPYQHQPAAPTSMNQLSELQSRFNRLPGRVSSPPAESTPVQPPRPTQPATSPVQDPQEPAAGGTTWAQKQAALRTASQFNKDPSSVSTTDARAAAGTARDFQQRHGEQVASGWQRAKELDSKYGVRGKVGGLVQSQGQAQSQESNSVQEPPSVDDRGIAAVAASKKAPPPPPPPKRRGLQESAAGMHTAESGNSDAPPPPVPLSSKPTW